MYFDTLFKSVITNLKQHKSIERRDNSNKDNILIGLLKLCEKFLK